MTTPTSFAQLNGAGLSLQDWNERHVFFMAQVMGVLLR